MKKKLKFTIARYLKGLRWREAKLVARTLEHDQLPKGIHYIQTVGELIEANIKAMLKLKERTQAGYRRYLLNMVDTALRYREGLPRVDRRRGHTGKLWHKPLPLEEYPLAASYPLTGLTAQLVADFISACTAGLTEETEEWYGARVTAASQVANAKAMFSTAARAAYRKQGFILPPNIDAFCAAKTINLPAKDSAPPHEARIEGVFHAALEAEKTDKDLFLIIALALWAGLTRSEIIAAQVDWLGRDSRGTILRVGAGTSMARIVPIPAWLHARLSARVGYFVPGATAYDRNKVCTKAVKFLKENVCGGDRNPLDKLVTFYAWYLASCSKGYGLVQVKSMLGHARLETTRPYFQKEHKLSPSLCNLWEQALPQVAPPKTLLRVLPPQKAKP